MSELRFVIPGEPVAWQRAGLDRRGRGHHYTQGATRVFEARVAELAGAEAMATGLSRSLPLLGPVRLDVRAFWPTLVEDLHRGSPARLKSTRPDADNVAKGVADGLKNVLGDDGQVSVLHVEKWHAQPGDEARTEVLVAQVDEDYQSQCDLCAGEDALTLRAACHMNAPLAVRLLGDMLVLSCYVPACGREVARFKIAGGAA